jgi:hypothetical protein
MLGSCSTQIISGKPPFFNQSRDVVVMNYVIRGVRPDRHSLDLDLSDEVWSLMVHCWAHQPSNRPSIATICENLWMICNGQYGVSQGKWNDKEAPESDIDETPTPPTPAFSTPNENASHAIHLLDQQLSEGTNSAMSGMYHLFPAFVSCHSVDKVGWTANGFTILLMSFNDQCLT